MQPTWILYRSIWALNLVASALVIWRLLSLGLAQTYRYFLISMTLALARSALLFPFSPYGQTYYQIWAVTQPVLWLSYFFVVWELYSLVLSRYPGIYSLSRWFFGVAVALAVLVSGLTVLPTLAPKAGVTPQRLLLYYYAFIERGFVTSLGVFLILLIVLVAWFTMPLSRNLLIHCTVYTLYFFSDNVIMLYWHTTGGRGSTYIGTVSRLSVALLCLMSWVFFLSRRGENRIASLRLGRNVVEEKKLLGQLENLNATLLRTARK